MTKIHIEFYAFGYNKYNLYGTTRTIHAEIDAIKKLKKNYGKSKSLIVLIFRISKNGTRILLGKPCQNCISKLNYTLRKKKYRLSHIYYTTYQHTIQSII
jgi:deoxycytidylate deaminase